METIRFRILLHLACALALARGLSQIALAHHAITPNITSTTLHVKLAQVMKLRKQVIQLTAPVLSATGGLSQNVFVISKHTLVKKHTLARNVGQMRLVMEHLAFVQMEVIGLLLMENRITDVSAFQTNTTMQHLAAWPVAITQYLLEVKQHHAPV